MKPARLVAASLAAALALTTLSAAGAPKAAAPKPAPSTSTTTSTPSTPKVAGKKTAKKAPKKVQPAPVRLEPLPPPVEPRVEVAESVAMPAPSPTPAATTTLTSAELPAAPAKDAPAAQRKDPVEGRPLSLAPLLGYATQGLNAGVGLRAGYTLKSKVYVGASFVYQHGMSLDVGSASLHAFAFYPSAEIGYEVQAGAWTIRPYAGAGVFFTKVSSSLPIPDQSNETVALYPGLSVLFNIPGTAGFIGGDARLLIAEGRSLGGFVTGGVRF
jgi:opacity protein-like surface antigen